MRPTLFGGSARGESQAFNDWVLVRYGSDFELQRFDLVVLDLGAEAPIVKRVIGLPGESIRVVDGDVFIDGKRLGCDLRRPAPITVFDDSLHPVSDTQGFGFCVEVSPKGPWTEEAGVWHLKGAELGSGRDTGRSTGMMFYDPDVRDGYLDQDGNRIAGFRSVNDVVLEVEVALDLLKDRLRLQLSEAGDLFEARFRKNDATGSGYMVELIRSRVGSSHALGTQDLETLEASAPVDLVLGQWLSLSFSNVDNCVTLECTELELKLSFTYESNVRFPGKPAVGDQNVGARAGFGGEGIEARFRSIKLLRDLHYTAAPKLSVADQNAPAREEDLTFLGPTEIFLLGDNSSQSTDSRSYGAVALKNILGRPVAVVWPPKRVRSLVAPN